MTDNTLHRTTKKDTLLPAIKLLLFLGLLFGSMYVAKSFLVPVCIAWMLAVLLIPLARKLERKGVNRGLSTFISVLTILIAIAGVITLLSLQLKGLAEDTDKIESSIKKTVTKTRENISTYLGISPQKQEAFIKKQSQSGGSKVSGALMGVASGSFAVLGNFVLVMVYIFLFLYFRAHFKKFVLKAVKPGSEPTAEKIIDNSAVTVQKYLFGLAKMIGCLWIMYSIGFSIAGVKYAIFFAILCGLLEIVPFVGNLLGTSITLLMAFTQGDTGVVIGVAVTYASVQFIQSYFLEPLIVGKGVNINPVFTILAIVLGELVWGIAGMVLFLPLLAIVNIVLDNIPPLEPYGFLIGNTKKEEKGNKKANA